MIVKKYLATFLSLFYMNVAFAKVTALGENQPEKTTLEDGNTFEEEEKLEEKEELEKPKDDKSKKLNSKPKESAKDLLYGFLSGTAIGSVVTAVGSYAFNKSRATGVYEKGVSEKLEELVKKCKSAIGEDGKNCENYEDDLSRLEKIVDSLVSKMAEASEESKELEASKMQLERELNSCKSEIKELDDNLRSADLLVDSLVEENKRLKEEEIILIGKIQEKDKESGDLEAQLFNLENELRNLKAEIEKLNDSLLADQHGEDSDDLLTLTTENEKLKGRDETITGLQKANEELKEEKNRLISDLKLIIGLSGDTSDTLLGNLLSIKSNMIKMISSLGPNDGLDKKSLDELSNNLVSKGREELNALEKQLLDLGQELRASEAKIEKLDNELKNRGASGAVPALLEEENNSLKAKIEKFQKEIGLPGGQSDNDFIQELLSIKNASDSLLVTIRGDTEFTSDTGESELQLAKKSIESFLKAISDKFLEKLYGLAFLSPMSRKTEILMFLKTTFLESKSKVALANKVVLANSKYNSKYITDKVTGEEVVVETSETYSECITDEIIDEILKEYENRRNEANEGRQKIRGQNFKEEKSMRRSKSLERLKEEKSMRRSKSLERLSERLNETITVYKSLDFCFKSFVTMFGALAIKICNDDMITNKIEAIQQSYAEQSRAPGELRVVEGELDNVAEFNAHTVFTTGKILERHICLTRYFLQKTNEQVEEEL